MKLNYLFNMTTKQVRNLEGKTNIALFPMGPCEVHGTHLPMMVDVTSANEMTERAAQKLKDKGIETLIAPTLHYTLADIANSFDGNITLKFETVANIVEDVCLGLAKWGFNKIVIICAHGEPKNNEAIKEGIKRASLKKDGLKVKVSAWFHHGLPRMSSVCKGEHPEWDFHAGEWETGLILLRHPELVDQEELIKLKANYEAEHLFERISAGKNDWKDVGAPLAYLGDPQIATKETGDKVYDIFSDIVVEEVLELIK
ncbi:MAG: creatininase family protein [Dehalobacter sp. 4CP]|uniref:creatininase family protein n=1 Tax=Dehalobacter sp. CP TaxID=2594474 RepID=UPI0013CAD456|nr:creatininase family protein [Dehalobacter sp. 4CP]